MKIGMTSIFVNDVNTAYEIYTQQLGFKELMYQPEHSLAIVVSPEQPDGTALLLEPNDNPIARTYQQGIHDSGLPAIVLYSDDLDRDFEALRSNGVSFRQDPVENEYGKTAIFSDGCGNLIQIHQQRS